MYITQIPWHSKKKSMSNPVLAYLQAFLQCRPRYTVRTFNCSHSAGLNALYGLLMHLIVNGKVIPGHALRVPGGWGSQISRQSTHEGGKVVSPTHRPPSPPMKYSWYSFLLEAESTPGAIVRPEGLCQNEKFQWHHRESNPRPSGL